MTEATTKNPPPPPPPSKSVNRLGLDKKCYVGAPSTMCNGCGHDAITNAVIAAAYELGLDQRKVAKLSGIGCSSKTPAYFMPRAHGFNTVHGRMPSVATGAFLANRTLQVIGMSGDGDTASIGLGQFCHLVRRNVPMVYIIENNGVYGLTKGQFSATADVGSVQKGGALNEFMPIDCCAVALELGCGFVARSFSGDQKQLKPLLKAAFAHRGMALLDVISPCVTFNNHAGSTKSYDAVKQTDAPIHEIGFVPFFEDIAVDYPAGGVQEVKLPDGSTITLKKLGLDYDPTNRAAAQRLLADTRNDGKLLTGLLYIDPEKPPFDAVERMAERPLAGLDLAALRPPKSALDEILEELT